MCDAAESEGGTEVVQLRLPPAVKAEWQLWHKYKGQTMSRFIRDAVEQYIRQIEAQIADDARTEEVVAAHLNAKRKAK